jgi:hypothetical protein
MHYMPSNEVKQPLATFTKPQQVRFSRVDAQGRKYNPSWGQIRGREGAATEGSKGGFQVVKAERRVVEEIDS